ncbi:unnamed protein product [Moneuplotes crassus]|uniref:Uncharacterized protein n=1 Tax=Euplotes crassus TaxID=5936 RepID=A0AAD2D464_EUPCR|nr:unnamed protein product [Moneuplotes crassus]
MDPKELQEENERYKDAFAKMERQWRDATMALKSSKNNEKLVEMSNKVKTMNIKLINLRKENQKMKEKMKFKMYKPPPAESEGSEPLESPKFNDELDEKIQFLKDQMKEKNGQLNQYKEIIDSNYQSEDGGSSDRISSILRQKDLEIQRLTRERNNALEKFEQVKNQIPGSTEFKQNELNIDKISAAEETIAELQQQLQDQEDFSKKMIANLENKCKKLENQMKSSPAKDRFFIENEEQSKESAQNKAKITELQSQATELRNKLKMYEKRIFELENTRSNTFLTILERESSSYKQELEIANRKIRVLEDQNSGDDNEIISQQKELIADLSKRVKLLQEEINLISRKHHEQLMKLKNDPSKSISSQKSLLPRMSSKKKDSRVNMTVDYGGHMPPLDRSSSQMSQNSMQKKSVKQNFLPNSGDEKLFSLKTSQDRELMSNIDQLEIEDLKIQMLKMMKKNEQLENNLGALKQEMSSKLNLLSRENENAETIKFTSPVIADRNFAQGAPPKKGSLNDPIMDKKFKDLEKDNEDAYHRITVLEEELKVQEQFFRDKLRKQQKSNSKMQEDTLITESKFVNIMGQLNNEQSEIYAKKKKQEMDTKDIVESAQRKIKELEDELEFRSNHFKTETEKLKSQNKMLKETASISRKEGNDLQEEHSLRPNKQKKEYQLLLARIDALEEANRSIQQQLQLKETEVLKALKQVNELTDKLNNKKKKKRIEERKELISPSKGSQISSGRSGILKKQKSELFLSKWEDNEHNDDARIELLNDFIHSAELRLDLFKRKNEFLICINQCIESNNPSLYEKGVIIISDLIDIDVINNEEISSLKPANKAIICLQPKKINEESHYAMVRQVSALNLLCKLDQLDYQFDDECMDSIKKNDGVNTVVSFLEQNHQQGYKAQACQLMGMMIEGGTLDDEIENLEVPTILKKLTSHKNNIVRQNAEEALQMLEGEDSETEQEKFTQV